MKREIEGKKKAQGGESFSENVCMEKQEKTVEICEQRNVFSHISNS